MCGPEGYWSGYMTTRDYELPENREVIFPFGSSRPHEMVSEEIVSDDGQTVTIRTIFRPCKEIKRKERLMPGYKITEEEMRRLDNDFTYHPPKDPTQTARYEEIRAKGKEMAELLLMSCPRGQELYHALRRIEECIFWANAAIARGEEF